MMEWPWKPLVDSDEHPDLVFGRLEMKLLSEARVEQSETQGAATK